MKTQARVVIVGGGVMGAGLLYHLAAEGWTDCLIVEKAELTSGSTWHAAGQCPSFIGDYNMAKIHWYAHQLYPKLEEMTGQSATWHGCGGIRLATTPEEVDWFKVVRGFADTIGFRMEIIGPDEIRKINPFVKTDGVLAGAWTMDDGHVDPAGCCNALAKGARDMGAEIVRHNRVLDIRPRAGGAWEVITEEGAIICEHVVNAAGCYAREVAAMVGIDAPITNMEHQYVVTEPIQAFVERNEEIPVMRDATTAGYFRQEQKAGLVGIYEHQGARQAWAATGGSPAWEAESELFDGDIERIAPWLERAMERMPIFAEAGIRRVVNGGIPHSPDGNPLLGPAAGLRNFWMCCGCSIGLAQGAGCGKYLAQWMVHGQAEINMQGFDSRRFGAFADQDYTRAKSFQDYAEMFVTHLPGEELPAGRPRRTTPLFEALKAKGGVHTAVFGWERPKWFSRDGREEACSFRRNNVFEVVAEECRAVRQRVGVLDLSSFAKFDVAGADAGTFLDRLFANRMPRKVGGIVLAHLLTEDGMIESEATVTRLAPDRFYVLSAALSQGRDLDTLTQGLAEGEDVSVADVTDDWGVLVLTGPASRQVLAQLTEAGLDNASFPWLSGRQIEVAGVPTRALRVSYAGELGWELHCPMARLADLYGAVWEAGEASGIADFGVYALDSMRLEKAYRGWGGELTNEITMIEADMERFVDFDKGAFVGREALLERRRAGASTRLVYMEVDAGDSDVAGGEPVFAGADVVGVTTSGGYGHHVGKSLAFAYVDPDRAAPGSGLEVALLGERRGATVLAGPVYDPDNARLRA